MARLGLPVLMVLGLLSPSVALKTAEKSLATVNTAEKSVTTAKKFAEQMKEGRKLVDKIYKENVARCSAGDVDGATLNGLKWWNKGLPKLGKDQFHHLLDVCIVQQNGIAKDSALGQWLHGCVGEQKDCFNPPLQESMLQMTEQSNREKIQAGLGRLFGPYHKNAGEHLHPEREKPDPRIAVMHESPGIWVRGCFWCNLAMNIGYACDPEFDRTCLVKDDPFLSKIDEFLFVKMLPWLLKETAGGPTPPPPPSLTMPPLYDHTHKNGYPHDHHGPEEYAAPKVRRDQRRARQKAMGGREGNEDVGGQIAGMLGGPR